MINVKLNMPNFSIFTTMTNPEGRNDAWKEAIDCYQYFADEVIIVGESWPEEFSWEYIGQVFQEGYDKSNSDWVMRMDIDYFMHENDKLKLRKALKSYEDYPVLSFPQYQFFTPRRYQIKTRLCLLFNKKKFKNIKLNGGGDLTLATLDNILIDPKKTPMLNIPIYQYESTFRTKSIIEHDRARFARAWFRHFGNYQTRGGPTKEEAFNAWYEEICKRYPKHSFKLDLEKHPVFIKEKLSKLQSNQFGFNAFGLEDNTKFKKQFLIKGLKEKYVNPVTHSFSKNFYLNNDTK